MFRNFYVLIDRVPIDTKIALYIIFTKRVKIMGRHYENMKIIGNHCKSVASAFVACYLLQILREKYLDDCLKTISKHLL